jgi:hypothetical protein
MQRAGARVALAAVLLAAVAPASARGDDGEMSSRAKGAVGQMVFALLTLTPSDLSVDLVGPRRRAWLGWCYQIPLGIFSTRDWSDGSPPLMRHRVVFGVRLALDGEDDGVALRVGWRYRARHAKLVAPFAGVGATFDARGAALSPEVGLHLGRDGLARPGMSVGMTADVHANDAPSRVMAVAGWTLW